MILALLTVAYIVLIVAGVSASTKPAHSKQMAQAIERNARNHPRRRS